MLSRLFSFVVLASAGFGLAGASVRPSGGSYLRAEDHRVATVAHRIAIGAVRHCPERAPVTGLQLDHLAEYAVRDQPALAAERRLDRGAGVLSVVEASAAAQAGLVAGDVIVAVNGIPLAPTPGPARSATAIREAAARVLEGQLRLGPVRLRVLGSSAERGVTLTARMGCPARARLARSERVNAVVDGGNIVLTTAVLAETRSDDELAVIIGHELAHVVLRHGARLREQRVPRGWRRSFGKNAKRVLATEIEADRLGIKLAAAAGYDMAQAIPFWRRFYARHDGSHLFRTHPRLAERERIIRETLAELEWAGLRGAPLP